MYNIYLNNKIYTAVVDVHEVFCHTSSSVNNCKHKTRI